CDRRRDRGGDLACPPRRTAQCARSFAVRIGGVAARPRSGPVEGVWGNRAVPPTTTSLSESLGLARERIRRPVELDDLTVRLPHDLEEVALLRTRNAAKTVGAGRLEDGGRGRRGSRRVARFEPPVAIADHDLVTLRPPAAEQRLQLRRNFRRGTPRLRLRR